MSFAHPRYHTPALPFRFPHAKLDMDPCHMINTRQITKRKTNHKKAREKIIWAMGVPLYNEYSTHNDTLQTQQN